MKKKVLFTMEFPLRCSPSILFELLSTAAGLQEWFAEKVERKESTFYFTWEEDSTDEAECIAHEEDKMVKFRWEGSPENEYFEFDINISPITNETILVINDFSFENEIPDQRLLWETQVSDLRRRIGG